MFTKVMVPLDLQDKAGVEQTLAAVAGLEKGFQQVVLLTVLPDWEMPLVASYFPKGSKDKAVAALQAELDQLAQGKLTGDKVECLVCVGEAQHEIVKKAQDLGVDLIIMKAHQHDVLEKIMLGSVAAKVVERAHCSVLVLKG